MTMMTFRFYIVAVFISISSLYSLTKGCDPVEGHNDKPLSYLAKEASNIIYGSCTNVYYSDQERTYEFDIYCVLQGSPFPRMQLVNITDSEWDCTVSGVEKGNEYIVFVKIVDEEDQHLYGKYTVDEINIQSAAHEPTEQNFQIISSAANINKVDCDGGIYGNTIQVPCFTDDGYYSEDCSGGIATKSGISFVLIMVLLLTVALMK